VSESSMKEEVGVNVGPRKRNGEEDAKEINNGPTHLLLLLPRLPALVLGFRDLKFVDSLEVQAACVGGHVAWKEAEKERGLGNQRHRFFACKL
jgi:hypothetical protein